MYIRRIEELTWHWGVLHGDGNKYNDLKLAYQQQIFEYVSNGLGNYLRHDILLASEAVWFAFENYRQFPRQYQPRYGSLLFHLQLSATKRIQQLLDEEHRHWHFQQLHFILARYFDNEMDFRVAKLIIREMTSGTPPAEYGKKDMLEYVRILNAGALRIDDQLKEVQRNVCRILRTLRCIPVDFAAMANRRLEKNRHKTKLAV